jgi:hypothetical protein
VPLSKAIDAVAGPSAASTIDEESESDAAEE